MSIFPTVCDPNPKIRDSVLTLPSCFNVMAACLRIQNNGNLDDIDACIGAPLLLFK